MKVIVESVPKGARRAQENGFAVVITQAPIRVFDYYEAVAYVDNAKFSARGRSVEQAWAALKAEVTAAGGKGNVAIGERKRTLDYTKEWGKIKANASAPAEEEEVVEEAPAETAPKGGKR